MITQGFLFARTCPEAGMTPDHIRMPGSTSFSVHAIQSRNNFPDGRTPSRPRCWARLGAVLRALARCGSSASLCALSGLRSPPKIFMALANICSLKFFGSPVKSGPLAGERSPLALGRPNTQRAER